MIKKIIPLVLISTVAAALFFTIPPNNKDAAKVASASALLTKLENPLPAPDFKLLDMDGEMHSLSSYKGKPVIINFWATWCPPCRAELPSMNRGWAKVKDEGIAMIAINVGEDEDTIFAFMGEYPIDFTVLLDESGEVSSQWPIKGLPTTFILDKEGNIVYRAIGGREWDADELLNSVRALRRDVACYVSVNLIKVSQRE